MNHILNDSLPWIIASFTLLLILIALKHLVLNNRANRSHRAGKTQDVQVVMSGAMGNGKTHLWSRLIYGTDRIETVTSMVENRITLHFERQLVLDQNEKQTKANGPAVCLVDTPGHPRLSCRSLARNIPGAKGVIFVIDSQLGLSGKGLRDTAAALDLVLSLLQLLHYQHPDAQLPRLSIHLSNPISSQTSPPSPNGKSAMMEKTRVTLSKELNRRRISPSNANTGFRKSRLESLDAIPSSELNSFFDLIKRLFKLNSSAASLSHDNTSGPIQLPEEESEVTRLLEEAEEDLTTDHQSLLSPLDRYERFSGHPLHWTISGQEEENEINLIKKWMIEL